MNRSMEVVPDISSVSHVSWGAIFAGTLVALSVELVLGLLGMAVGLSAIDPATEAAPLAGMGTGAVVWWGISTIVALYAGGWVTSRMAGVQRSFDGFLHGFLTWGLATILTVFLAASTVGAVISGGMSIARGVLMASSRVLANRPGIVQDVREQIPGLGGQQGQQQGQQQQQQQPGETGGATGGQAAQQAVDTAAATAFGMLIVSILGAFAAGFGGTTGRVKGPVKV